MNIFDHIELLEKKGYDSSVLSFVFNKKPESGTILQTLQNTETGDTCYLYLKENHDER